MITAILGMAAAALGYAPAPVPAQVHQAHSPAPSPQAVPTGTPNGNSRTITHRVTFRNPVIDSFLAAARKGMSPRDWGMSAECRRMVKRNRKHAHRWIQS